MAVADFETTNAGLVEIARLTFNRYTRTLYDDVLREVEKLKDQQAREGIASARGYERTVADLISERVLSIQGLFEKAYLDPLNGVQDLSGLEKWLRGEAHRISDMEARRAGDLADSLCPSFAGGSADHCRALALRVRGEGGVLRQCLEQAITLHVLRAAVNSTPRTSEEVPKIGSMEISESQLSIFISHSSADSDLAEKFVQLLRAALNIPSKKIRCTSVDGYRLPAGAHSETQLRTEVMTAKCFIGLITSNSLESMYVLLELGARWGARLRMIPLLAGVEPEALGGPLKGINALTCSSESQVHQLIEDLAQLLGQPFEGVSSYTRLVTEIVGLSRRRSIAQKDPVAKVKPKPNLVVTDVKLAQISQIGDRVWSATAEHYLGHDEAEFAARSARGAFIIQFTNEALTDVKNCGALVKARLSYQDADNRVRAINGCWLDLATDFAEIRVDDSQQLIVAMIQNNKWNTAARRRISADLGAEEIVTLIEPLPANYEGTVTVRLTNADTGEFLFESKYRLSLNPAALNPV